MKNKKIFLGVMAVLGVALTICLFHTGAPEGVMLAFAAIGGVVTQGTVTTTAGVQPNGTIDTHEIDKASISHKIAKINPSLFPMDTILREMSSVVSKSNEYKYYSVRGRGTAAKISVAYTPTAGSEAGIKEVSVINAAIFSLDGNLLFPSMEVDNTTKVASPISSGVSYNPLICHIVGVDLANNKIRIFPLNAAVIPALAVDTPIYRLGVAKDELAAMSEDPSQMPYSDSNFCQIHMTTVSEGLYQKLQEKEVDFGLLDMKEQALLDFRMTNEADALFGVKSEFIDPVTKKTKRTSDGIIRKISKHLDMGSKTAIDNDLLWGWAADIFCGNNGSDRRLWYYGKDFGRKLAASTTYQKQLEAGKTEMVLGVNFLRVETPYGTMLLRPHDLLNEYGYSSASMIIDPANLYRAIQKPLETTELERDKAGISRSTDVRLDESHCIAVINPDTHALITVD